MRYPIYLWFTALGQSVIVAALSASAAAQTGRVRWHRQGRDGQPIKGATLSPENPDASPQQLHGDDRRQGPLRNHRPEARRVDVRGAGTGLRHRSLASCRCARRRADPPPCFTLKRAPAPPPSALGSVGAKDLQAELRVGRSAVQQRSNGTRRSPPTAAILAKAPALSVINLQIAAAYRNKKDYDNAIAAYSDLLKADPSNDKAQRRHRHDESRKRRSRSGRATR